MKNDKFAERPKKRRGTRIACVTAAFLALTVAPPQATHRDRVEPPLVPESIQVEAGHRPFLVAHAIGTQAYICQLSGTAVKWVHIGPQATLFDEDLEQVLTHFLSPNPIAGGTPDATWQHSRDTSAVWARKIAESSDAAFVAPGAIPWFLLREAGSQEGPTGGDKMTRTTFIHRVNTTGGQAPSNGCSVPADINSRKFVPYTADYFFYEYASDENDDS
jgi:hypothetical protein